MRAIAFLGLAVALSGCAIQIQPESKAGDIYRTPVAGASAQVVVSQEFQTSVVRQKPTIGTSWGARTFEIPVGRPVTQSLVTQVRSIVPNARIGDRHDGSSSSVTIIPQSVAVHFGVDDKKAANTMALVGVFGVGSKAEIRAEATLSSDVEIGGESRRVVVMGASARQQAMISISQADMAEVIGEALDDAAGKLVATVEESLRSNLPQTPPAW